MPTLWSLFPEILQYPPCIIYLFIFINLFYLFKKIFWLHWVFVAACGFSLVAASRVYSLLLCAGFSLRWLLLLQSTGSRHTGFSSCGTRAQQLWLAGSRAQAQQLWLTGPVAPWHVGSSPTRARTRVPWTGRRIPNPCAREAPTLHLNPTRLLALPPNSIYSY